MGNKTELRFAVAPYVAFLDPCVLLATTFSDIRKHCRDTPGISVEAQLILKTILSQSYTFSLVSLPQLNSDAKLNYTTGFEQLNEAFHLNLADLSLDLWLRTVARDRTAMFSYPIVYLRHSFIASMATFRRSSGQIVLALDWSSWCCIGLSILLVLLVNVVNKYNSYRSHHISYTCITDIGREEALLLLGQTAVVRQEPISYSVLTCHWITYISILQHLISAVLTDHLTHVTSPPFKTLDQLYAQVVQGHLQLISTRGDIYFEILKEKYPKFEETAVFEQDTMKIIDLMNENPKLIYPSSDLTSALVMKDQCQKYGAIMVEEGLQYGLSVVMKNDSQLHKDYLEAIALVQPAVQHQVERLSRNMGCKYEQNVIYNASLNMHHLRSAFIGWLVGVVIAILAFTFTVVFNRNKRNTSPGRVVHISVH